jgi:hypothetical protein
MNISAALIDYIHSLSLWTFAGFLCTVGAIWLLRELVQNYIKSTVENFALQQKNELETNLLEFRTQHEIAQAKTSRFFDHQRSAFVDIIVSMAEATDLWWQTLDQETGLPQPVPMEKYTALKILLDKHRLFLTPECTAAMYLLYRIYDDSLPFRGDLNGKPIARDTRQPFENAEYLQPRITALFQQTIGLDYDPSLVRELALFGAAYVVHIYGSSSAATVAVLRNGQIDAEEMVYVVQKQFQDFSDTLDSLISGGSSANHMPGQYRRMLQSFIKILKNQASPTTRPPPS